MPRTTVFVFLALAAMACQTGCAVDPQPEASQSSDLAVSTAVRSSPRFGRECDPGAHHRTGSKGEDRDCRPGTHVGHAHKPELPPLCGNGAVEAGESCDDGNVVGGDGCSAICQPDDDTSTPGDDRAGFVACGAVTCVVGDNCCPSAQMCLGAASDCGGGPMDPGNACDGPEDCPVGLLCSQTKSGIRCSQPSGGVFAVLCHTDADCVGVDCPVSGGSCPICVTAAGPQRGTCGI
jgi:cysteine-rich repeat protein